MPKPDIQSQFTLPPWPPDSPQIRQSVADALASGQWGRYGAEILDKLSDAIAQQFDVTHVRLCASGTVALEFALQSLGIGPGDEVIVSGYDFPGNLRAVERTGGSPVLIDVQPGRYVFSAEAVEEAIGPNTRAIIASHLYGDLFDADSLLHIAHERQVPLIEDACQAHGAQIDDRPVGSFGHLATLSFGGSKLMTAGVGGALLTSDERLAAKATRSAEWPSLMAPMSPLQAAVLLPQLESLTDWNQTRRSSYQFLSQKLQQSLLWRLPQRSSSTTFYKVPWLLPQEIDRELVLQHCIREGLPMGSGFVGYLRRCTKKYRTMGGLENCYRCLEHLVLLEHRTLLADETKLEQVAEKLIQSRKQLGERRVMKIVLTNDDGFGTDGLLALLNYLQAIGEVTVVAPARQHSECSHSVTSSKPLLVEKRDESAYIVEGTPVDCIRFAISEIAPETQLVISGINHGGNLGTDIWMSGTVAAAREAYLRGIPAIAVSQYLRRDVQQDWGRAGELSVSVIKDLVDGRLEGLWNVNLPAIPSTITPNVRHCDVDGLPLPIRYGLTEKGYQLTGSYHDRPRTQGKDVDLCFAGHVTVSKL